MNDTDLDIDKLLQSMDIEFGSAAQRAYSQDAYNEAAQEIRKRYGAKLAALVARREEKRAITELKNFNRWIGTRPEYQNITFHTLQRYWDLHHKIGSLNALTTEATQSEKEEQ